MMTVAAVLAMLVGGVWLIAPAGVMRLPAFTRGVVEDERLARLRRSGRLEMTGPPLSAPCESTDSSIWC